MLFGFIILASRYSNFKTPCPAVSVIVYEAMILLTDVVDGVIPALAPSGS